MKNQIYQINKLEHFYNDKPVLNIDSLSIRSGSITGIIGPNGSGKSTLLRLISFIEKPSQGEILFKNKKGGPFLKNVRLKVALLTQEAYLMNRSVFKNIAYGLQIRGDTLNLKPRVYESMSLVGLSYDSFASRNRDELSGGEARRAALAARLILKPEVLLLDEPTASVDEASAQLIKEASLRARDKWGGTLVIVSHDWQWLYEICDNILFMFKGRILNFGEDNIIQGPWKKKSELWEKKLNNGSRFYAYKPPTPNAVAVFNPVLIEEYQKDDLPNVLNGTLYRLNLEKNTGNIMAMIAIGNVSFNIRLTENRVKKLRLYPGGKVLIGYDPTAIKWL